MIQSGSLWNLQLFQSSLQFVPFVGSLFNNVTFITVLEKSHNKYMNQFLIDKRLLLSVCVIFINRWDDLFTDEKLYFWHHLIEKK